VVKISSQDLRWRQEEIDLTDVVRAKLTWPDSNAHIPMRIDGILAVAPNSPVYLVIHVDPFKLDRIMGTPLGVEMMVDGETIPADIPFVLDRVELHEGHSIPITIDTALPDEQLDTAPLKVSAGIPSLSVAEIRALLPGELE
jgi:hypothetical protein